MSRKPTNPKDLIGITKMPLQIVPAITHALLALGHGEGLLKYGYVNWRAHGVRVSVYVGALLRHLTKYMEGEWADPRSKVPHIANALACLSILADSHYKGNLVDDRPLSNAGAIAFINGEGEAIWRHLISLYGHVQPKHYTIQGERGERQAWRTRRLRSATRRDASSGGTSRRSSSGAARISPAIRTRRRSSR